MSKALFRTDVSRNHREDTDIGEGSAIGLLSSAVHYPSKDFDEYNPFMKRSKTLHAHNQVAPDV
jgi:hypothetical protein